MSAGARRLSALIVAAVVGPLGAIRSAAPESPAPFSAAKQLIESIGHILSPPAEAKTEQEAAAESKESAAPESPAPFGAAKQFIESIGHILSPPAEVKTEQEEAAESRKLPDLQAQAAEVRAMRENLTGVWQDVDADYDSRPDIWRFHFHEQQGGFACRVETKEYQVMSANDTLLLKPAYDEDGIFTGFEGVGKGPWVHEDVGEVTYRFWLDWQDGTERMHGQAAWPSDKGGFGGVVMLGGWRVSDAPAAGRASNA